MTDPDNELARRILAIEAAEGPEGYRLLVSEFVEGWLRVEGALNVILCLAFLPGGNIATFNEMVIPEMSMTHRLDVLRDLAERQNMWKKPVTTLVDEIRRYNAIRNQRVHRPAFFGGVEESMFGRKRVDLSEFKEQVHHVAMMPGRLTTVLLPLVQPPVEVHDGNA